MTYSEIIDWLLEGDVSIQYQVHRDLFNSTSESLRSRIEKEGWGSQFLSLQTSNGHWGLRYYQPKWTSTHYTLLDLKNLGVSPNCTHIRQTISLIVRTEKGDDGGINPSSTISESDVCLNGMALNFLSYFRASERDLHSIVDFLLSQQMSDGGFNCYSNRGGANHSSLHTTLSVLEGIQEFISNGYSYRVSELKQVEGEAREFILEHRLYKSHRTGGTIDRRMLSLAYPSRWRYDVLRALDYFHFAGVDFDERMADAIDVLTNKRSNDMRWRLQANHPGRIHFDMEAVGEPSRWNTLRVLRVFRHFGIE